MATIHVRFTRSIRGWCSFLIGSACAVELHLALVLLGSWIYAERS